MWIEICPKNGEPDEVLWPHGSFNNFSGKSYLEWLQEVVGVREFDLLAKSALRVMCETKISSKVKSLRWRLILDRLPTRSNLAKRGIIHNPHDKVYVFCFGLDEDIHHVFIYRPRIVLVWKKILVWIGVNWINEMLCCNHLMK